MSARPPNEPWLPLDPVEPAIGYASYYYSDELAAWPVRAISRIGDNKSDPNIETGTYGLFSTCEQKMRSGIVANRPRYLFFVSRPRSGRRQLTGYYELGWYAPGTLSHTVRDFALAATRVRFIEPSAISTLDHQARAALEGCWRLNKRLTAEETAVVLRAVDTAPDVTEEYREEVSRLEQINLFHSGYRYPTWRRKESFSWADAARYLGPADSESGTQKVVNASPTGWWRCVKCPDLTKNAALLKACPHCGALASLRPATATDLEEAA